MDWIDERGAVWQRESPGVDVPTLQGRLHRPHAGATGR